MTNLTRNELDARLADVRIRDIRDTITTLIVAMQRDHAGGPVTVDGYPTSTLGTGPRGTAELTSVEAAAHRIISGRPERDVLHDNLEQALGFLTDAINACRAFEHRVRNLADIMGNHSPRRCEITLDDEFQYSTVGGRLHRKYSLSKAAYDFVCREGRIPTAEEAEEYRRTGVFIRRIRVS